MATDRRTFLQLLSSAVPPVACVTTRTSPGTRSKTPTAFNGAAPRSTPTASSPQKTDAPDFTTSPRFLHRAARFQLRLHLQHRPHRRALAHPHQFSVKERRVAQSFMPLVQFETTTWLLIGYSVAGWRGFAVGHIVIVVPVGKRWVSTDVGQFQP